MISTIIVVAALGFAVSFFIAWLLWPDFRRRIESPKYDFQDQLRRYDRQRHLQSSGDGVESDESR